MNWKMGNLILLAAYIAAAELPPADVLDRMEDSILRQQSTLESWTSTRVYTAGNVRLNKWAKVVADVGYAAPGTESYTVRESTGMGLIVDQVIRAALNAERESLMIREQTDINRANYGFVFLSFDPVENAYLFEATPRTKNKFLFRGRVWVDADSFGVMRVVGRPANSPSIWVMRSEFTHEFANFGGFWLPVRHRSTAELLLFGTSKLEIDYGAYHCSARTLAYQLHYEYHAYALRSGDADGRIPGTVPGGIAPVVPGDSHIPPHRRQRNPVEAAEPYLLSDQCRRA